MKIYTKGGDKGRTSLASGKRVSKTDLHIEAYGTSDELNSLVGLLRSSLSINAEWAGVVDKQLGWIQNRLFDLGAILAGAELQFAQEHVAQLEMWMDVMDLELPELKEFVLPGGGEQVSRSHVCRCVCRRLERCMVKCLEESEMEVAGAELRFVNRLSDYFFVLARFMAKNLEINLFVWEK